MEIKQHPGHLSYKQPAVWLLKTKKFVKNLREFVVNFEYK